MSPGSTYHSTSDAKVLLSYAAMLNEPIEFNEDDFDYNIYDFYTFMIYKGELFTGILKDGNQIIEYKNGNADGRAVDYYDNGQLSSDEVFREGKYCHGKSWYANGQIQYDSIGKSWYENGQLKHDKTGTDELYWDTDGKLAKVNRSWLYKSGQKMNEYNEHNNYFIYSPNGEVAVKTLVNGDKRVTYYYQSILYSCYEELLINLYPHLEAGSSANVHLVIGWAEKMYNQNRRRGKELLHKLTQHPNWEVQQHAKHLLYLADRRDQGTSERLYWLEDTPDKVILP